MGNNEVTVDKVERLINLTAILRSNRPVSIERLLDTVYYHLQGRVEAESIRKMFERDRDSLRELGIIIETVPLEDGEGGYIISSGTYLPNLDFSPEERIALVQASRFFTGSGTPLSGPSHSAMVKMAFDGESAKESPRVHWVGVSRNKRLLGPIFDGIKKQKNLVFSYRSLNSEKPVERKVSPYGLINRFGYWYLVGRSHLRDEIRSFKLDRITSKVKVLNKESRKPDFKVPEDFDIKDQTTWDWKPEKTIAKVLFESRLAFTSISIRGGEVKSQRKRKDGLQVTYLVEDSETFIGSILDIGTEAQIISPQEFQDTVKKKLKRIVKSMKGKAVG